MRLLTGPFFLLHIYIYKYFIFTHFKDSFTNFSKSKLIVLFFNFIGKREERVKIFVSMMLMGGKRSITGRVIIRGIQERNKITQVPIAG